MLKKSTNLRRHDANFYLFPHSAKDKYPFMIFFLLPVGLMTSINVILFVLTMIHCNKIKMEIARVQRSSVKRKKNKAFVMNKAMYV